MDQTGRHSGQTGLRAAYARCESLARDHYENFPIASRMLPQQIRDHMYALYAFARGVDDLGDEAEGDRRALLDGWERQLRAAFTGEEPAGPDAWVFEALASTVSRCDLPIEPFLRLIEANRRDQETTRYETFAALREYCTYSADPVGRLVLGIFGYRTDDLYRYSDAICTALQLTNFWQDVSRDLVMGRIYLPAEEMRAFGVTEEDLRVAPAGHSVRDLFRFQVERTRALFDEGRPITRYVKGRFRIDLLLFSRGGEAILDAIDRQGFDVIDRRPVLGRMQRARLLLRALGDVLTGVAQ